jgi:hypothetical protein
MIPNSSASVFFVGATLTILFAMEVHAQSRSNTPPKRVCYESAIPADKSTIRRILVDVERLDIRVEFEGASKVPYFSDGSCEKRAGGKIHCSAICDGGNVDMAVAGTTLNLMTKGFALAAEIESALPMPADADRNSFSGSFTLKAVDAEVCEAAFVFERMPVLLLQRGDFTPRVARVKKYLADLGYFAQPADWYFDAKTESAVLAFQRAVGLSPSGVVDEPTNAKLKIAAETFGGC